METWTEILGWCTIINGGLLILTSIALVVMRRTITAIHARMFGMDESDLPAQYFRYVANFKIAFLVFNLAPYIAMKLAI